MSITHPNNLTTSQAGIDFIKRREGFRSTWYLCSAGKPTIGYGHLMNAREQRELFRLDEPQAHDLLLSDIRTREIYINSNIRVPLSQHQFDALVSFVFNLGMGALEPEKSTLRRLLDAGDYAGAAKQMLRWNKEKNPETGRHRVNKGLTKRRQLEMKLFLEGIYE